MTEQLRDWVLVLGFDNKEVVRGIRSTQKMLNSLRMPELKLRGLSNLKPIKLPDVRVKVSREDLKDLQKLREEKIRRRTSTGQRRESLTGGRKAEAGKGPSPKSSFTPFNEERQLRVLNQVENFQKRINRSLKEGTQETSSFNNRINSLKDAIRGATSTKQLNSLSRSFSDARTDAQGLTSALREQERQMKASVFASQSLESSVKNLARSYFSIFAVIEGSRSLFKAGKEMDSLNASMLAASKTAEEAETNLAFVVRTSQDLGINLIEAGKGYTKIGAAAKSAGLSTQQTQEVFLSAAEASRTFGLNAERTNLVFLAFSQILSKGKVSQEELRRQLGEQLPGVMNVAADAMGVTTGRLEEMIKTGISASEFLPKFSKKLRESVRENNALATAIQKVEANQQRLLNSFTRISQAIFNAGGASLLKGVFSGVADIVNGVAFSLEVLGKVLNGLFGVFETLSKTLFGIEGQLNIISSLVKGLAVLLAVRLASGFRKTGEAALFGAASVGKFSAALKTAKIAAKQLLRALGIGLLIEAGGFVFDRFISPSLGGSEKRATKTVDARVNNQVSVSVDARGMTEQQASQAMQDALAQSLGSSPDTAGI